MLLELGRDELIDIMLRDNVMARLPNHEKREIQNAIPGAEAAFDSNAEESARRSALVKILRRFLPTTKPRS